VNVRSHKTTEDSSVEGAVGAASKELVKTNKEANIDVLALAVGTLGNLLTATGSEIDTLMIMKEG